MQRPRNCTDLAAWASVFTVAFVPLALAQSEPLTGAAAFGDWHADKPGVTRLIRPADLPKPGATPSSANVPHIVRRPPSWARPVGVVVAHDGALLLSEDGNGTIGRVTH